MTGRVNMLRRDVTVDEIDEVRRSHFMRAPDRPDTRFIRLPADPKTAKARQRLRTAAWRKSNDERGRPTAEQIGSAMLVAVCQSSDFKKLLDSELSVVTLAVNDLISRGFRRKEIEDVMRRIRWRHVDPLDRQGEATEDTSAPIEWNPRKTASGKRALPSVTSGVSGR
jgi:hypothetical protein